MTVGSNRSPSTIVPGGSETAIETCPKPDAAIGSPAETGPVPTETRRSDSRAAQTALTLAVAAVFAAVPLLGPVHWPSMIAILAALTGAAALLSCRPAMHVGLFAVLLAALLSSPRLSDTWPQLVGTWPLPLVLAIGAYLVAVAITPTLRAPYRFSWFQVGRLDRQVVIWLALIVAASNFGLAAWYALLRPDLSDVRQALPMPTSSWGILAAVGFALLNASAEEVAFRGIVLGALERAWGPGLAAVLVQAGIFGMFHLNGVPRGASGIVLAGLYGILMGLLKRRSGGLLAPFVAHVFADVAVIVLVAGLAD